MSVAGWTVTDDERATFAAYSGDHNPLHTDPVAARRLLGGHVLVHGAHLLLRVLGQAASTSDLGGVPGSIDVTFRQGVRPGELLTTTFAGDGRNLRATVSRDGERVLDVVVTGSPERLPCIWGDVATLPAEQPVYRSLDSIGGVSGAFDVAGYSDLANSLVPEAVELLGSLRVAELASLSRLIGMHVPGLYSMSSRYQIALRDLDPERVPRLEFRVVDVDPRMRRVRLDVDSPAQHAVLTAFALPEPVDQRRHVEPTAVAPGEFAGWRALVVGGSRGLGEAAVRLLAAGGADVRFTYRVGATEAGRVAADTGAQPIEFDARGGSPLPPLGEWAPTHLCWFAAPPPGDGDLGAVKVDAFATAVDALAAPPLRGVLWPSSTAADEVSKEGEKACEALAARLPHVAVRAHRLPVLRTDRTATLMPTEYADTTAEVLAALRAVAG